MTISCSLGPQLKDEVLSVDVKVLLNTEVLKSVRSTPTLGKYPYAACGGCDCNAASPSVNPKDSSSVIQFVTRASMQVNSRAVEVQKGLPEDFSVSSSPSVFFFSSSPSSLIHRLSSQTQLIKQRNQTVRWAGSRCGYAAVGSRSPGSLCLRLVSVTAGS